MMFSQEMSHMKMVMIMTMMMMMMTDDVSQELSQQLQISHVETSARFSSSQFEFEFEKLDKLSLWLFLKSKQH